MFISMKSLKGSMLFILVMMFLIQACKKDDDNIVPAEPDIHSRAEIAEIELIDNYDIGEIEQILSTSGTDFPFDLVYEVDAYSVKYYTRDHQGNIILVSGGLYVPRTKSIVPLLSIQHGTETKRNRVASVSPKNSVEGIVGLMTASMGYLTILPDYPGFGISYGIHPYLHAASNVPCVVDLILAGKELCSSNSWLITDELFLMGYSEGGYISLLALKEIEQSYPDLELTAVAPLAGPYHLAGMFDQIFGGGTYGSPAYVAYFLTAYNHIYQWDCLDQFFKEPYAMKVTTLFNGTKTWDEIVNALPSALWDLMHEDFVANFYSLKQSMLLNAINANTMLNWSPEAPVHFFHGDCDDIVDCMNATQALDAFLANGATDIQLTMILGGNHETTGPKAIEGALKWFETYRGNK